MSRSPRSESPVNVDEWIAENKKFFLPPVCNRMMHDGQLKVFFVGGPNTRQDYHLNEGEEFFFMIRGDMSLKVIEKGKHKDIFIREGEVFLLPSKVPHSPQRKANTVGLVIERERKNWEMDGLRFYLGTSNVVLYERWFHCVDLGSQLKPIIDEFFDSNEFRTQKPGKTPYSNNDQVSLMKPFSIMEWMRDNEGIIEEDGSAQLFTGKYASKIEIYGQGEHLIEERNEEMFLWQLESGDCSPSFLSFKSSSLGLQDGGLLLRNQCIVIPAQSSCRLVNEGSKARTLVVSMPSPVFKSL